MTSLFFVGFRVHHVLKVSRAGESELLTSCSEFVKFGMLARCECVFANRCGITSYEKYLPSVDDSKQTRTILEMSHMLWLRMTELQYIVFSGLFGCRRIMSSAE